MRILIAFILLALPAMAGRDFVSASSQFCVASAPASTYPITIAAWVKPSTTNANAAIAGLFSTDNRRLLLYIGADALLKADAIANADVTPASAAATTGIPNGTWSHAIGIWDSSSSRRVYLSNGSSATNTTALTTSGLTTLGLGARINGGTWGLFANGGLAEVAVWNVALSADERLSLSIGTSPILIRPASLLFYAPLTGRETSTEWNLCGSAVSLTNSPAASSDHPRIYRP